MIQQTKPPGWGADELSLFIDLAQKNEWTTCTPFTHKNAAYELLRDIDIIYQGLSKNLINTKDILPGLLYLRAHSAYRASCILSMSGQIIESFALDRYCLEYSLYAYHIHVKPDAGKLWISRHDNIESHKKCRSEFGYTNVLKSLTVKDPRLAKIADNLYEICIFFGGHVNEKAISASLKVLKTTAGFDFNQQYMVGDSPALDRGLLYSARVGLCSLFVLDIRFALLGINDELNILRNNLGS
jgi:hypothetical protein